MALWGHVHGVSVDGPFSGGACAPAPYVDSRFLASGRIDNRAELASSLGIAEADQRDFDDGQLMLRAWKRWGEDAPGKIFGDWIFAAWDPSARRLFVARDHASNTTLYYYAGPRIFAFASSARALLSLNLTRGGPDELYLAQMLVSWTPRADPRTSHSGIHRLPPSYSLTVSADRLDLREYWRPEDIPELRLANRAEYVEAFREVFDRAVRDRIPRNGLVATTLSGGLDSGAVTVTSARQLREQGRRLQAFTSIPIFSTTILDSSKRFADELPFAQATADAADNIDLATVDCAGLSPLAAVRRTLEVALDPQHAAVNMFWMLELNRRVAASGCGVLLTGQLGNAGASWIGDSFSHPIGYRIRHLGLRRWLRGTVRRAIPRGALYRQLSRSRGTPDFSETAIRPEFAQRMRLGEQMLESMIRERKPWAPRNVRSRVILNGLAATNALYAEMAAADRIEIRDPMGDARLLALSLSVPDRIFIDPEADRDRWLIREAMKGRLPDKVRLNPRRGFQSADLVSRLQLARAEMDEALAEIARGPAAEYLDVPRLYEVHRTVCDPAQCDTLDTRFLASAVLMRGVMAGLFVNRFGSARAAAC